MRHITLIILLIVLAGCPSERRIYLHNKSQETIVYKGFNIETVTVGSGKTKAVYFDLDSLENCFEVEINGATRAFNLDREYLKRSWKTARYGERFDIYYEYDRLYIQTKKGGWLEFETITNCQNVYRRYIFQQ